MEIKTNFWSKRSISSIESTFRSYASLLISLHSIVNMCSHRAKRTWGPAVSQTSSNIFAVLQWTGPQAKYKMCLPDADCFLVTQHAFWDYHSIFLVYHEYCNRPLYEASQDSMSMYRKLNFGTTDTDWIRSPLESCLSQSRCADCICVCSTP